MWQAYEHLPKLCEEAQNLEGSDPAAENKGYVIHVFPPVFQDQYVNHAKCNDRSFP